MSRGWDSHPPEAKPFGADLKIRLTPETGPSPPDWAKLPQGVKLTLAKTEICCRTHPVKADDPKLLRIQIRLDP